MLDEEFLNLLEFMLQISPLKRPTAQQVLGHSFFRDCPEQVDLDFTNLIEENKIVTTFAKPRV